MLAFATSLPLSGAFATIKPTSFSQQRPPCDNSNARRPCRRACISMIADPVAEAPAPPSPCFAPTTPTPPYDFSDPAFAAAVSGEWFGYEASFSSRTGDAQSIPERFVPEAFRDWDVDIRGFDALTSTTVLEDGTLLLRRTRALPTVGCEADAVVPDVAELILQPALSPSPSSSASDASDAKLSGAAPDGSFSTGPAVFQPDVFSQRWAFCIAHPQLRTRARVEFGRVDERVGAVVVHLETWDADFCRGEILPGCGGSTSSFVDDDRTPSSTLAGRWSATGTRWVAEDADSALVNALPVATTAADRGAPENALFLPRGLSVCVSSDANGYVVEAGWLVDPNTRAVARRKYAEDGGISFVEHLIERKES